MKKNKGFTVIGYWGDNAQPYMEHVSAANVMKALGKLRKSLGDSADNLWIVEVVAGRVYGCCGMDSTTRLVDLLED